MNGDEKHATEVKLRNLRNVLEIHLRISFRFNEHYRPGRDESESDFGKAYFCHQDVTSGKKFSFKKLSFL